MNKKRKKEIEKEYQAHCAVLGDFVIKNILFNPGIQELMKQLTILSKENE